MRFFLIAWMCASALIAGSSAVMAQPSAPPLPMPVLKFTGTETYSAGGKGWVRYRFDVANKSAFPSALFAASPNLPPCGLNKNSARTWVDFFDHKGKRLYGFCALGASENLSSIWFAAEACTAPPPKVYIVMHDRLTGRKCKSNLETVDILAQPMHVPDPDRTTGSHSLEGPFMVFFDLGKSAVTPSAGAILQNASTLYLTGRAPYVSIIGHTDSAGSPAVNRRLAERRVAAVRKYLALCGIPHSKISAQALGEKRKLVESNDEAREPQNRRVEIEFSRFPYPAGESVSLESAGQSLNAPDRWDEAEFQRKLADHQQALDRHRQAVAEFERQKAATEDRKAQLRAQAEAAQRVWERRVAACRAGDFSQCQ